MSECPLVWVIIGVSGSGKSLVGRLWAEKLECDFLEGDRRHPLPNIMKMLSHKPLQDEDRYQWLEEVKDDIQRANTQHREIVISCSALKVSYRKYLTSIPRTQLVWLNVPKSELERRLKQRLNHYMKPEMLSSQLDTFEAITPEENVIIVNGLLPPTEIVKELLNKVTLLFPEMKNPWWERCNNLYY